MKESIQHLMTLYIYAPSALQQNGEFRMMPSSGEILWLHVSFPGMENQTYNRLEFLHDRGTTSNYLCLYGLILI